MTSIWPLNFSWPYYIAGPHSFMYPKITHTFLLYYDMLYMCLWLLLSEWLYFLLPLPLKIYIFFMFFRNMTSLHKCQNWTSFAPQIKKCDQFTKKFRLQGLKRYPQNPVTSRVRRPPRNKPLLGGQGLDYYKCADQCAYAAVMWWRYGRGHHKFIFSIMVGVIWSQLGVKIC